MPTFCQPIVFVQVNHPDSKTSRPHVRLCLPDTTTFEEAFTAALAVEDGSLPRDLIAAATSPRVSTSTGSFPSRAARYIFSEKTMKTENAPKLPTHRENTKNNFSTLAFFIGWLDSFPWAGGPDVGRRPQIRTLNLTSTLPSLIMYIHNNLIFHDSLNETQLNYFTCEFNCEC